MYDLDMTLEEVDLALVDFDPNQPRQVIDSQRLRELADSIRSGKVKQPPLIKPNPEKPGRFVVVAGERRIRALREILGAERAKLLVLADPDRDSFEDSAAENFNREDLDPIDQATTIQKLRKRGRTFDEIATLLGRSKQTISNTLRLLELPPEIQDLVRKGTLTRGRAWNLLQYKGPKRELIELAATLMRGESLTPEQELILAGNDAGDKADSTPKTPREPYAQILAISEGVRRAAGVVNSIIALLQLPKLQFDAVVKRFPKPARANLLDRLRRVAAQCLQLAERITLSEGLLRDSADTASTRVVQPKSDKLPAPAKLRDRPLTPDEDLAVKTGELLPITLGDRPLGYVPCQPVSGVPDDILEVLGSEVFVAAQGILFVLLRGEKPNRVNLSLSRLSQELRLSAGEARKKAVAAFRLANLFWGGVPNGEGGKVQGAEPFSVFVRMLRVDSEYGREDFEEFLIRILEVNRSKDSIDLNPVLSSELQS